MSSRMVSRWPVLLTIPVGDGDLDEHGLLTEGAVEWMFARAREVYLGHCETLHVSAIEVRQLAVKPGPGRVEGDEITISVGVVEVYDDRFTMNARLRGAGEAVAGSAWCSLSPGGPVTTAMRDEFIALAHAATHFH